MNKTASVIVIIIIAATLVALAYAAVTYLSLPTNGTILTAAGLTANPTSIDWGTINQGSQTPINRNIALTNTGQQTTQPLTMTYTTAIGTLTWTGEGQTIGAGQTTTYTFTLTPAVNPPGGPFSFQATIGGS